MRKMNLYGQCVIAVLSGLAAGVSMADASVTALNGPGDFTTPTAIITFDDVPHYTILNSHYSLSHGVTFTEDAGGNIPAYDFWSSSTVSNPNVLATILDMSIGATGANHVTVLFSQPITEVGAYFGNDQGLHTHTTLSLYDSGDNLLGSLSVATNDNKAVDQYVGLSSTVAFVKARFENTGGTGGHSLVIDNLQFTTIPEPATLGLLTIGGLGLLSRRCRRESSHAPN